MFLFLLIAQSPNWQKLSFRTLGFLSFLPIIFIVIVLFILFNLSDSSFHNLYASLEWLRISSLFTTNLLFFLLVSPFLFIFILPLKLFNVGIPNLPLSNLSSQIVNDRRVGSSSSLFDVWICRLNLSAFIIELIPHSLLNSLDVLSRSWLLLLGLPFDLFKFNFSVVLYVLLYLIFIWGCMDVVSF